MKKVCLVLSTLIILLGCSRNYQSQKTANCEVMALADIKVDKPLLMESPKSAVPDIKKNPVNLQTHEKKIIKDGKIGLLADSVEAIQHALSLVVKKYGGYIAVEKLSNEAYRKTLDMTIRIPAKNFENLISEVENGKCKVLYKNINARDVTEEFMDIESRLQTKRKFVERYQELLKKANVVKDILEIEENLRTLQEEIESSEGRLKYLNDQVDYSTLDISVNQSKETVTVTPTFGNNILDSIKIGWQTLVTIFLFIIKIWPILLLYLIAWFGIKHFWKKYKARKAEIKKS